ncbi:EAL domain-containing protein [Paraferrimonas haliotis]|uniref:Diguanylate cyclase n=1 Tax=Paraferrimonas haliotis TaxID=2013866 RepID=A0AA37TU06_9GAMM|nr:GGDEF domain-containing protein [Paraferrimonas haliotis]GLS84432.1 diguanylate cyclase [Paraferrimonas haliotis]
MGFSKTFLSMLILVLCCVGAIQTHMFVLVSKERIQLLNNEVAAEITRMDDSQQTGAALYLELSDRHNLSFYQYSAREDFSRNFTYGDIEQQHDVVNNLLNYYGANQTQRLFLARGTVNYRVDASSISLILEKQLLISWIIILSALLLIGFSFVSAFTKMRQQIRYASNYIERMPLLEFESVQVNRLSNECKPLAKALQECRSELKIKIDDYNQKQEQLARSSNVDAVTGLATRLRFVEQIEAKLNEVNQSGLLVNIRASELGLVNQTQGMRGGDNYLSAVAKVLSQVIKSYPRAEAFRIGNADFAAIIPNCSKEDVEKLCKRFKASYDDLQVTLSLPTTAYTGAVSYSSGMNALEIMSMGDTAVNLAQTLGPNHYSIYAFDQVSNVISDHQWQNVVRQVISSKRVVFLQQTIHPCRKEVKGYKELLARFVNESNEPLPTATVIAMAERYGLAVQLDKMIIVEVLKRLIKDPSNTHTYGINVSATSSHNKDFLAWLKDLCSRNKALASRLIFEVSEAGMQTNLNASQVFVSELHKAGARVCVERFGLGFSSFKFFREIRPDFIKLAGEYSHSIDTNSDNAFFVRMVVDIARRMSIRVFATSVERQQEKLQLEKLLVDGQQGYYIAKPEPIFTANKELQNS